MKAWLWIDRSLLKGRITLKVEKENLSNQHSVWHWIQKTLKKHLKKVSNKLKNSTVEKTLTQIQCQWKEGNSHQSDIKAQPQAKKQTRIQSDRITCRQWWTTLFKQKWTKLVLPVNLRLEVRAVRKTMFTRYQALKTEQAPPWWEIMWVTETQLRIRIIQSFILRTVSTNDTIKTWARFMISLRLLNFISKGYKATSKT